MASAGDRDASGLAAASAIAERERLAAEHEATLGDLSKMRKVWWEGGRREAWEQLTGLPPLPRMTKTSNDRSGEPGQGTACEFLHISSLCIRP